MPRHGREHAVPGPLAPRRPGGHVRRQRRRLRRGGRRPSRPVAHRARQPPQAFGRLRVDLLDQPGHRVEGPPRVLVGHIEQFRMRPLVARRDQLLDPRAVLAAELLPKQVVPAHVHDPQTPGGVELRNQRFVVPRGRKVTPLALVEDAQDASAPPLALQFRAQLLRHVGRKHRRERPQPFRDPLVVGAARGGGHRILQHPGHDGTPRPARSKRAAIESAAPWRLNATCWRRSPALQGVDMPAPHHLLRAADHPAPRFRDDLNCVRCTSRIAPATMPARPTPAAATRHRLPSGAAPDAQRSLLANACRTCDNLVRKASRARCACEYSQRQNLGLLQTNRSS